MQLICNFLLVKKLSAPANRQKCSINNLNILSKGDFEVNINNSIFTIDMKTYWYVAKYVDLPHLVSSSESTISFKLNFY